MTRRSNTNNTVTATETKMIDLVDRAVVTTEVSPSVTTLDRLISEALETVQLAVTEIESLPFGVTTEDGHEITEFMTCLSDSFMIRVRGSRVYSSELLPESRRPMIGEIFLISTTKGKELKVLFGEVTLKGVKFAKNEGSTEILSMISRDQKKLGKKFDFSIFSKEVEKKFCYETILSDQAKKIEALCTRLEKQRALRDYDLASDVLDKYI